MSCRFLHQATLLTGVVLLALTPPSAHAQRLFGRGSCDCPCPPAPWLTPAEKTPTAVPPDQAPQIPPATAMAPSTTPEFAAPLGGELFAANMIGDFLAPGGGLRQRAILVPGPPICTTIP